MSSKTTENLGSPEVFATGIVFAIVAGIAVLCKAYTKSIVKTTLGGDDYWIFSALLFFWAEDILQLYCKEGFCLISSFCWLTF